ncbi:hypothetical protein Gohar_010090 [Gossypium harknessii]|uniref:Uncharacterized protein n=1 Tax=Gossypium harknessii TaxID=34285 RepID=A0A7J9GPS4_9ROSI|nr:hypothetical protein [Gossypium harknessii]
MGKIMGSSYYVHTWAHTICMAKAMAVLHGLQFVQEMSF